MHFFFIFIYIVQRPTHTARDESHMEAHSLDIHLSVHAENGTQRRLGMRKKEVHWIHITRNEHVLLRLRLIN